MATRTDTLQKIWRAFESEHGHVPSTAREACEWGVDKGMLDLPVIDPYDVLAGDMARALREEYATDSSGRRYRVNHAVRVTKGGVQYTFWAQMGYAEHPHMVQAFAQRREQIVGDCLQLKIDVDAYNGVNTKNPPVQLVLDFTDDIAERLHDDEAA